MQNESTQIAASYLMELIEKVEQRIWEKYQSHSKALSYIKKYHEEYWNGAFCNGSNFEIIFKDQGVIDLNGTLDNVEGDMLMVMAIDLGIETPDFIPAFPTFKNTLKESTNLKQILDIAFKNLESDPALSIANANSALESLLKNILKKHSDEYKEADTLKKLVEKTLKLFGMEPHSEQDKEIKQIGSGLVSACQAIESLRSNKTSSHGKAEEDYLVRDSLSAYFVINSVATIGLYIDSFYKKRFNQRSSFASTETEIDPEDIPF